MKKKYGHIFFDWDHTLWDFEKNSTEALFELYDKYSLERLGVPSPEVFAARYQVRNDLMWDQFDDGKISRDVLRNERFAFTFRDMGLDPESVPRAMTEDYIRLTPTKTHLIPYAKDILDEYRAHYRFHLITNGFRETQQVKISASGLRDYFQIIVVSEVVGYKKPDKRIFDHALEMAGAGITESIMVGDTLKNDILGAKGAGMDQAFFNRRKVAHNEDLTHEISCLSELRAIL